MARTLILLAVLVAVSPVYGDAVIVTQAMKASTIAEIFVERDAVRIELEIGAGDKAAISGWFVAADGKAIEAMARRVEKRTRVKRDEITGEPLPVAEGEGEPVVFLELAFPFDGTPSVVSIRPPLVDGRVAANIGFVAYHQGVLVSDFRYLAKEATLDLDWEDPWYSKFRHRNLQRRFSAPLNAFLYVEPFEVRQEIVLRPKDLQQWVDLGLEGKEVIPAAEQEALKEKIIAFLKDKNPVAIDGKPAAMKLDRVHFIRRTLRVTSVIDPPEDLPVVSATLGVIFYAPTNGLPQEVTMRWDLWGPRIQSVPASSTDEAGALPYTLAPDDPVLVWTNLLKNPSSSALVDVDRPVAEGKLPVAGLVAALLALVVFVLGIRRRRVSLLAAAAGMAIAAALTWPYLRVRIPTIGVGVPENVDAVVGGLLTNVYRSFDRREESVVYDRLARSITGPLLEDAFLQIRKSTELANQGGARIKVKDVALVALQSRASGDDTGFVGECTWDVSGSVGHWGHVHTRTNRYRASLRIKVSDGVWKIGTLDVLEETRLSGTAPR